jgi:DNA-binding protein YbaB
MLEDVMDFAEVGARNQVFQDMLEQLKKSVDALPKTKERMTSVTGVSFSDDRMVKVVVGPRGQLVDLEIDPRVFRQPDAKELSAKILATAREAVRQATGQMQEIMAEQLPPDTAEWRARFGPDRTYEPDQLIRGDAEIYAERKEQR